MPIAGDVCNRCLLHADVFQYVSIAQPLLLVDLKVESLEHSDGNERTHRLHLLERPRFLDFEECNPHAAEECGFVKRRVRTAKRLEFECALTEVQRARAAPDYARVVRLPCLVDEE